MPHRPDPSNHITEPLSSPAPLGQVIRLPCLHSGRVIVAHGWWCPDCPAVGVEPSWARVVWADGPSTWTDGLPTHPAPPARCATCDVPLDEPDALPLAWGGVTVRVCSLACAEVQTERRGGEW